MADLSEYSRGPRCPFNATIACLQYNPRCEVTAQDLWDGGEFRPHCSNRENNINRPRGQMTVAPVRSLDEWLGLQDEVAWVGDGLTRAEEISLSGDYGLENDWPLSRVIDEVNKLLKRRRESAVTKDEILSLGFMYQGSTGKMPPEVFDVLQSFPV